MVIPFCLFTLVLRSIFRRFLNFAGTSSTSASSWELLEPIVSIPSGKTFNVDSIFFLTDDLLKKAKSMSGVHVELGNYIHLSLVDFGFRYGGTSLSFFRSRGFNWDTCEHRFLN